MTDITADQVKEGDPHLYDGHWNVRSIYGLFILTMIYTINYVDRQALSLVLPKLKKDLALSDFSLGIVTGFAFVLFYSTLGIPVARLADRANRRNLLSVGLAFWSLMTVLGGLVSNVWQLGITRFLMGAGEATAIAPSTSMTTDMFTGHRKALALGILTSGTSVSALLFFPILGWISQHYGWRVTFMAAGAPGLLLALLLYFTVREPARRTAAGRSTAAQEPFGATMRFLAGARTYVMILIGATILGISLYATQIWNPTFLDRIYHLDQAQLGASVGLARGLAGLFGAVISGYVTGLLVRRDERWLLIVPGIACALMFPAELLFLFAPNLKLALVGLALSSFLSAMHFGPIYAACQSVARTTMRTTSVAIYLLCANLVGQIVGPMTVGYLNDHWSARFGPEAIRYSLALVASTSLIGGVILILATSSHAADRRRSES